MTITPPEITVGDTVTLDCSFTCEIASSQYHVMWKRDDVTVANSNWTTTGCFISPQNESYLYACGGPTSPSTNITIESVTEEEQGVTWSCSMSDDGPIRTTKSTTISVISGRHWQGK